ARATDTGIFMSELLAGRAGERVYRPSWSRWYKLEETAGRTAVRNLCKSRLRTASGPEGSSAKQILYCAAGPPDRGRVRCFPHRPLDGPRSPFPHGLSSPCPQVATSAVR